MTIAIMSETFGRTPYALAIQSSGRQTAEWMGRLKVKPGSSLDAAESRMRSRH